MMRLKRIAGVVLTVTVLLVTVALPLLAVSDISDARWSGEIRVTNVGAGTTNVSVPFDLDTALLISGNYIDADCENTAIMLSGADVPYMPAPGDTTDWIFFKSSVPVGSSGVYLYAGGADMNSKLRYFPAAGGMTKADDNVDFELGANFSIEQKGLIDTGVGADKNLVYKQDAFHTSVSAASTLKTAMLSIPATQDLSPDAVGDYANITTANPAVAHYLNVDDPVATPDDAATTVSTLAIAQEKDVYNIQAPTWLGANQVVTSVTVYFRHIYVVGQGWIQPYLRLAGVETAGTEIASGGAWATNSEVLARPGGGAWTLADITNLQIGIGLRDDSVNSEYCTQVYARIAYTYDIETSITPVPSAEYTVKSYCDGTWLMLSLNGDTSWDGIHSARIATGGTSVVNNGNNWAFLENDSMPYMEYQKVTIGGTLYQHIVWEYETAAPYEFTDLSTKGNPVVPTFRTTSSDVDVSASIISFAPTALGLSTSSIPGSSDNMDLEDVTEQTTAEDQTALPTSAALSTNPGYPIIHTIAVAMNTSGYDVAATEMELWYSAGGIMVLVVVIGLIFLIPGHLLISGIGGVAVIGLQVSAHIFPWWTIGVAVIYLAGTIVAERSNVVG
jgi:hypothetical protein